MAERKLTRRGAVAAGGAALLAGVGGLSLVRNAADRPPFDGNGSTTDRPTTDRRPSSTSTAAGHPTLEKIGHVLLTPNGGTSEVMVRADGKYGVVGTKFGDTGSYLVDLSTPSDPSVVHHLDEEDARKHDAKFDHRNGLYYLAVEGGSGSVHVVDYGYSDAASPENPRIVDRPSRGPVHNLYAHTAAPVLYTTNYDKDPETVGFEVWNTSDPSSVEFVDAFGPSGYCHDIVVEAERDRLHVAYQTPRGYDGFVGYVMFDISDPRAPEEIGRFDYRNHPSYTNVDVGEPGFGYGHHADFDPRRDVVIIGDERLYGPPGGKHLLDVSDPSNITAEAFTLSPNAKRMEPDVTTEKYDWTGHHFDFVPWGESTYIVSGDWHDGVVLYDVTDPSKIEAVDQYLTDDVSIDPNPTLAEYGEAPWTWNAAYDDTRQLVVANDQFTGLYVFELVD